MTEVQEDSLTLSDLGIPIPYDLETNNTKGPGPKKLHPAFGNKIVMVGHQPDDDDGPITQRRVASVGWKGAGGYAPWFPVGHNLKFDFGFVYHADNSTLLEMLANDTPVWDTQVAEYVNGSGLKSLEKACEDAGVAFTKDDEVKRYWEEGYDTEDIPTDILEAYLKEDLRATDELFKHQWATFKNKKLIVEMSKVSLALAFIEQEGMYVDEEALLEYAKTLLDEQAGLETIVLKNLHDRGWPRDEEFKPNSAAHLELLFFGGGLTRQKRKCVGKYKNGKDKYKKVDVDHTITAPKNSGELQATERTATGKSKFDDNWFNNNTGIVDEVDAVYRIRGIKKEMSTFVEGVAANRSDKTGLLHGDFNHCITRTGRLSSSNPNLQNLTNKSEFKKVFTSRYGANGWIVEIDYSQLEVAILACLCGDEQLLDDVKAGRDLHYETGKSVFGWRDPSEMDKLDRRTVKGVNFGLIYGGGAKTISNQTGAPVPIVQRLIDAFYARYPGVKVWQDNNIQLVKENAYWEGDVRTTSGVPAMTSQLVSPLGRVWKFTEDEPPWGGAPNFSPTRIKNYPVQGFATGDIVPIAVRLVAKAIAGERLGRKFKGVHLTSTVHDSIILDVGGDKASASWVAKQIASVMSTDLQAYLKDTYGVELPIELKAEASIGRNWYDQTDI